MSDCQCQSLRQEEEEASKRARDTLHVSIQGLNVLLLLLAPHGSKAASAQQQVLRRRRRVRCVVCRQESSVGRSVVGPFNVPPRRRRLSERVSE